MAHQNVIFPDGRTLSVHQGWQHSSSESAPAANVKQTGFEEEGSRGDSDVSRRRPCQPTA